MRDRYTFNEIFLTELQFARLLDISVEDFNSLIRSGIYAYTRASGVIEEYFIHIHPGSPSGVLAKLNIEQHNFLKFSYAQIQAVLTEE